jgi:hypothetical protein
VIADRDRVRLVRHRDGEEIVVDVDLPRLGARLVVVAVTADAGERSGEEQAEGGAQA